MEEPGRLQSTGSLESDMTERLHFHFSLSCIGEGNGNPLQCSCLENPRDGEAWWAAVYGVAQSRTRLKRLSSSSSKCPPKEQKWIFDSLSRIRRQRPLGPQAKAHVTISKDQEWARCELHLTKTLQHGLDTYDSVPHWIEILSPLSFYLLERLVLSHRIKVKSLLVEEVIWSKS